MACYYVTRGKPIRREKTKTASGNGVKFVVLWLALIFLGVCSGFRFLNPDSDLQYNGQSKDGFDGREISPWVSFFPFY